MSGHRAWTDPNDERDPEVAERLDWGAPEAAMQRREFLQRTAIAAGLASSPARVISPDTILAEASARLRGNVPSPRNMPIDTFVVLMMENRSFDHYLGWLPGADGRQRGLVYRDAAGTPHATQRLGNDFQGCAHPDPDHSWQGGRKQIDGGRMDGFLRSGQDDVFSISYYAERDLPFMPAVARAFTSFDRFFCSLLASTFPNRECMHSAQSYGMIDNTLPPSGGFPDTTIFAALAAKGVSSRYFYTDVPVSALWAAPGIARSGQVQVTAPAIVVGKARFELRVSVASEPGALDIAAQPIRLRVRLAPECGGSFAGTKGPTAIDRALATPVPGTAYRASASAGVRLGRFGALRVCVFLGDAQERQFATSTDREVVVTRACADPRACVWERREAPAP